MHPLVKLIKSARALGLKKLSLLALYKLGLVCGSFSHAASTPAAFAFEPVFKPFDPSVLAAISAQSRKTALEDAALICNGQYRPFAGSVQPLLLEYPMPRAHWTAFERGQVHWQKPADIKLLWEVGRFGWAYTLARAYAFSADDAYARKFWQYFAIFNQANPPEAGAHWMSAQEVALRLISLVFCDWVFASAPGSTAQQRQHLHQAIADHAARIPATIIYARAQNNNHLISEAVGLYTAGVYLKNHPQAARWRKTGWHWFNHAIQNQINAQGTYIQHSVNYHRLMLQLSTWMVFLSTQTGQPLPEKTHLRLADATNWLWALVQPENGNTPNLGANDGAYMMPLCSLPYADFRPVLQAAAAAFLPHCALPHGDWDEPCYWLGLPYPPADGARPQAADMPRLGHGDSTAFLRAAHFTDRPSHADQLHVDVWHLGMNIVQDAGTYHYSLPAPWDNALSTAFVHNTVTIDGQDQMTPAGRFLWLDWAQARIIDQQKDNQGHIIGVTAEHQGCRKLGIIHQREVHAATHGFEVIDRFIPLNKTAIKHQLRLHWLCCDAPWQVEGHTLRLSLPGFQMQCHLQGVEGVALVRAGEVLHGKTAVQACWGWASPTYSVKQPALAWLGWAGQMPPCQLITRFEMIKTSTTM